MQTLSSSIEQKIKQELPASQVEIKNFSSEHIGHDAGGAHIEVTVTDNIFKDKKTLQQHQIIYKILDKELKDGTIHALKINTKNE